MKIKKILMYVGIILGLILVIILGWLVSINKNANKNEFSEITPEQEISEEQLRQTIVTLYFFGKESAKIEPEARKIDAKLLIENPYKILINLLIDGPKNEELLTLIPEGTKLNSVEIKDQIVYIDFSEEFIKEQNLGEEQEKTIINSLLKTLIELNEVNGIKIIIDGKEDLGFPDNAVQFDQIFYFK